MGERSEKLLLFNAMLGFFLTGVTQRVFTISLPTVAASLGTDILGISWALISFYLASISLSLVCGRLGDFYGHGRIYFLGYLLLTASSVICGGAQSIGQLIVFRFVQGIGAAMLGSCGRALAMEALGRRSEGKVQGFMTVAFHTGFLVGPPLGGFLIESLGWRAIFFAVVPLGLAGTLLSLRATKPARAEPATGAATVDYVGAILLVALLASLVLLVDRKSAQVIGSGHYPLLTLVLISTLIGFLVYERRIAAPILNMALFRLKTFSYSLVSLLGVSINRGLLALLLPFYLQDVLGLGPFAIGLLFLIQPALTVVLSPLSGWLTDRVGFKTPAVIGVLFTMAAGLVGIVLRVDSQWLLPAFLLLLAGGGNGFFNTANQTAIIAAVPQGYRGFASGISRTTFDLGQMLGVSTASMVLTLGYRYFSGLSNALPGPQHPGAFVAAINLSCAVAAAACSLSLALSLVQQGGGKKAVES